MQYMYVCKANIEKVFDENGVSRIELPLDQDFQDVQHYGIKFYRVNMKAGATYIPELRNDAAVVLVFNGKRAYIRCGQDVFQVTEPAFFIPDFDKQAYTVAAIEDTEFIMGVFHMNDVWDWKAYRAWHKTLPFFKLYSNGVEYTQDCKLAGTRSWSILQVAMLGHVTIGVVKAVGAGTDEVGHPEVHQWNYCLGNSDFTLDVEGDTDEQEPGDFSFIFGGKDHKLVAKEGKEVFYVWIEYYTTDDCEEYLQASITNRTAKDAYCVINGIKD